MVQQFIRLILFSFLTISLLGTFPSEGGAYSKKLSKDPSPEEVRSTMALKKYMGEFGTLVAGMEIMRIKESKKPDWEAIQITIEDMAATLKKMQAADKAGNYQAFTATLEENLKEVQAFGKKKDKRVFDSFDKLTQTCFKCHAAHRPSDFPIQKKKPPLISQQEPARLFNPN